MATGPIETHLHRSFNWENAAPAARMGPRGRSANCGNGLFAQCVRLRSEINPMPSCPREGIGRHGRRKQMWARSKIPLHLAKHKPGRTVLYELAVRKRR